MAIISVVNQKGGTGKTTTVLNLSSALAKLGKKVLAVDLDAQGNLGYSLGLEATEGMVDVLGGQLAIEDALHQTEGFDLLPSDMRLVDLELSLGEVQDHHSLLFDKLHTFGLTYDYVLIDCPPSLSIIAVNALYASEYVIIPMLMEVLSLQGLHQIMHTIDKLNDGYSKKLEILGVLPVMVDRRRKLTSEVKAHIAENYEVKIFESSIRSNVKASESPSFGQSVIAYAPQAHSAIDYMAFAQELVTLI